MADTKQVVLIDVQVKADQVDGLRKSIKNLKNENKDLIEQQKKLKKAYDAGDISLQEYTDEMDDLTKSIDSNSDEIKDNNKQLSEANKELKLNEKAANSAAGSYDQLSAELSIAKLEWKKLSEEERENSERGIELTRIQAELNEKLKELDESVGVTSRSVGDYREKVKEAINETSFFGVNLDGLKSGFDNVIGGVRAGVKSFGTLRAAIAATGIGLFLIAITSLISFFKKTEAGANLLNKAMAGIGAVIDTVIGSVLKIGAGLADIFTGNFSAGIDKISGSFDGLAENIAKNVKAAIELQRELENIERTGNITGRLVAQLNAIAEKQAAIADDSTRSLGERERASKLAEKAAKQAATEQLDLLNKTIKQRQKALDLAFAEGKNTKELRKELSELYIEQIEGQSQVELVAIEAGKRTREIQREAFEQRLDYTLDIYDNEKKILEANLNDEKTTAEEKIKILNEIKEADIRNQKEISDLYLKQTGKKIDFESLLAEKNIATLNDQIQNGLKLNEIEANRLKEVITERKNYNQDIAELEAELTENTIIESGKQSEERGKIIDAEILADIERENEKNELLAELKIENESSQLEAEKLARETRAIALIEDETELANALLLIDQQYQDDKVAIQKASNEAMLASTAGILGQVAGLFESNTIASKVAGTAQALINTYLGATAAFAQTPGGIVIKSIAAAAATASGLASVAKINGIKAARGKLITGKKHAQGGEYINAEAGEVIINAASSKAFMPLLSDINTAGGGVPFMARGGTVGTSRFASDNLVRNAQKATQSTVREVPVLIKRDLDDVTSQQLNELQIETD